MNVGLLFLAVILIIAGTAINSVFVVIFGVLFLIAAVLPRRKQPSVPQRGVPPPAYPTPQARAAPSVRQVEKTVATAPPPPVPVSIPQASQPGRTLAVGPLFPSPILPALNPLPAAKHEVTQEKSVESRDEFLTLVALLGLISLFSKRR